MEGKGKWKEISKEKDNLHCFLVKIKSLAPPLKWLLLSADVNKYSYFSVPCLETTCPTETTLRHEVPPYIFFQCPVSSSKQNVLWILLHVGFFMHCRTYCSHPVMRVGRSSSSVWMLTRPTWCSFLEAVH